MRAHLVDIPVPDDAGVYTFADDLFRLFVQRQDNLSASSEATRYTVVTAPLSGERCRVASINPTGRSVIALEPHPDDFVLSAAGYFLSHARPLTVVTIFGRSGTVRSELAGEIRSIDDITSLRAAESKQALSAFKARTYNLGFKDADRPFVAYASDTARQVYQTLGPILDENPEAELIAPAAVCRHPDHRLVHDVARNLGCAWFWDDTGFQPTYAASVNDRHLFETRTRGCFVEETANITPAVLDKLALLCVYRSQVNTLSEISNVLRYNWTLADSHFSKSGRVLYAERFFRNVSE